MRIAMIEEQAARRLLAEAVFRTRRPVTARRKFVRALIEPDIDEL